MLHQLFLLWQWDDEVMQRRLESIGATLVREEHGGGKFYTLPANQVTLRKKPAPRVMSAEQRAAASERMRMLQHSISEAKNGNRYQTT